MVWMELENGRLINYKMITKIDGNYIYINSEKIKLTEKELSLLHELINYYDIIYNVDSFNGSNKVNFFKGA